MNAVGLVLFGSFVVLLLLGVRIYVALGLSALLTVVLFDVAPLEFLPQLVRSSVASFTLLAVPLFILAGNLLARSELAVHLLDLARALVGRARGGLAVVSVVVGIFFAGISGSGPADVAALGPILVPAMERDGYRRAFAAALIAATGAIGIIVPPSIALIVYGVVANVSIGRLFLAGIGPGLVIGASLAVVSVLLARRNGWGAGPGPAPVAAAPVAAAPLLSGGGPAATATAVAARPAAVGAPRRGRVILRALRGAVWGLLAPVLVLGGIYGGVFTPTEAAAVVAVYALLVGALVYRDLRPADLAAVLVDSARTTGVVMVVIASASLFAFVLTTQGVAADVANLVGGVSANPLIVLLVINVMLLVMGTFLDSVSLTFIFVPIFAPLTLALGVDPVHFGLIFIVNLAIGQITPPIGVNLYVACLVGRVSLPAISRAVVPVLAAEVVALLLITYVPAITLWLPDLLGA